MFIRTKYSGYNRHGEQCAAGYFLILTQPRTDSVKYPGYKDTCADCGKTRETHNTPQPVHTCEQHGIVARLRARAKAKQEPVDSDFQEIVPDPHCPDCVRHFADIDAQGCTCFKLSHNSYPMRAIVRYVRMGQFGQFMMGRARVLNQTLILSGSYGSDGLPCSVGDAVYDVGVDVPREMVDAWTHGGGWNSAGSEAPAMREWALKTFPKPTR